METKKFVRKPFLVDGVQITAENMHQVAAWCQGEVRTSKGTGTHPAAPYVHVRVVMPKSHRQTMGFVGDWVLYAGTGYKVYSDKAFRQTFDPANESDNPYYVAKLNDQVVDPPKLPEHVYFQPQPDDSGDFELAVFQDAMKNTGQHQTIRDPRG
jgi:hypothetical protein